MSNTKACWRVELNCECPKCKQDIDLLDYVDFWDGLSLEIGESGTERSENMPVVCPGCYEEFCVDLEY